MNRGAGRILLLEVVTGMGMGLMPWVVGAGGTRGWCLFLVPCVLFQGWALERRRPRGRVGAFMCMRSLAGPATELSQVQGALARLPAGPERRFCPQALLSSTWARRSTTASSTATARAPRSP